MITAGVLGATGYFGLELVRLLLQHPGVELKRVFSRTYAAQPLAEVFPHLNQLSDLTLESYGDDSAAGLDVLFLCTPHGVASALVPGALAQGAVCIDVSADYRLKSLATYQAWYKSEHQSPELLKEAVYGLPELYAEQVKLARLIANPGCYPTSILLGLAPLVRAGWVELDRIIIDSKSGVSGAGRTKTDLLYHYPEANGNLLPYSVGGHRHTAEVNEVLSDLTQSQVKVSFTPHLVPMVRGILSSMYLFANRQIDQQAVQSLYEEFYSKQPFVRVLSEGHLPQTKYVSGSNFCDVAVTVTDYAARPMLVVHSALDNLVKGAAGQAVQNMNLRFGLSDTTGLTAPGLYP